jgi:hypothetical protein
VAPGFYETWIKNDYTKLIIVNKRILATDVQ